MAYKDFKIRLTFAYLHFCGLLNHAVGSENLSIISEISGTLFALRKTIKPIDAYVN